MPLRMQPLATPDDRVALWLVGLNQAPSEQAMAALSGPEQRRAGAFVHGADAWRYRVAHCALRECLAQQCGLSAAELEFTVGPWGKPTLAGAAAALNFSLSHSGDLALIGVSRAGPVGVDLECTQRLHDLQALALHVMTAREFAQWRRLDSADQPAAFLRAWTRKEACLKAWGVGLHLSPELLDVGTDVSPRRLRVPPVLRAAASPLELWSLAIADNALTQAAVALGTV